MGSERLVAQRLDIGSELGRRWLPEMESVIFTSATMAVGESFEHFDHAVGLDVEEAGAHRDVRLSSSFDFERNMSVVIAQDMPLPGDPRYLSVLEELLFRCQSSKMAGTVFSKSVGKSSCSVSRGPMKMINSYSLHKHR